MASDPEEMGFFVRKWPPTPKKWPPTRKKRTFSEGNQQNPGRNGFFRTKMGKIPEEMAFNSEEMVADSEEMGFSVQRMAFSVLQLPIRKKYHFRGKEDKEAM